MTLKLSLVIPTRERASYLGPAIRSCLAAADLAGCEVEIIVSDNASTDDTAAVVAAIPDPRVIYRQTGKRLSMRENYQFALEQTSGSHIVYIGDDDAILPHGLALLVRLIARHDPHVVKWRLLNYLWPDPATGQPGELKLRPQMLDGRLSLLDPAQVRADFENARFRTYHEGAMIYHGCVSRGLVEAAVARSGGPYFWGSSPDVFTSMQGLLVSGRPMVRINAPVSMGGASPKSNGASSQALARQGGPMEGTEFQRFITETGNDPFQGRLPVRCPSLSMVTLDCLQTAARVQGAKLSLNHDAWAARIAREVAGFAEPARSDSAALAQMLLDRPIVLPAAAPANPAPAQAGASPARGGPMRVKRSLSRIVFSGGAQMADAQAAAGVLDHVTGLAGQDGQPSGLLAGLGRILALRRAAARLG